MGNSMRAALSRMWAAVPLMLCLALLAPAALAQGWQDLGDSADRGPYTLRPGDTLVVNVLEDPTLDAEVMVLPDGRLSLPMAGTIEAAGMTPQQLAGTVRDRLRKNFVQPPNVTVRVTGLAPEEEKTREVYVLGEVAHPGRFEYKPDESLTVVKALSLAGGLGPFAARKRIQVRERIGDTEVLRLFDYEAFEDGQIASADDLAALSDGAVVVVPERGLFR